jgi:hypothetical protein
MASKFMDGYTPEPKKTYRNDWERSYMLKKNNKQTPEEREEDMEYYVKNLINLPTNESKKKNIVKLTESDLKHIITESVKRIIKEEIGFDDNGGMWNGADWDEYEAAKEFDEEPAQFTWGVMGYDLNTGNIDEYEDGYNQDTCESYDEALQVIRHMLTYPENSSEYDLRYANNVIPVVYVLSNGQPVDDKLYLSNIDRKYYRQIKQALGNKYDIGII